MKIDIHLGVGFTRYDKIAKADRTINGFYIEVGPYLWSVKRYDKTMREVHKDGFRHRGHWWQTERNGLYRCLEWHLPFGFSLQGFRNLKSYAEAVGFDLPLDWIIDEFDSSFNDLAVASLRYHMDWSVCVCDDDRRARFQAMIDRLTEPEPDPTEDENRVFKFMDPFVPSGSGWLLRFSPEEEQAMDSWRARCDARDARIKSARKDFIDLLPELWS